MSSRQPSRGKLFVVAAPSGAGKTSLVNALLEGDERLELSVSYTTRPARPGEVDGRHYHFTDEQAFQQLIDKNAFLEHARVFGHRYGTHAVTTISLLEEGRDIILEIDWQGARQVRKVFPSCHSIFILPPSLDALRNRLGQRGQDSEEVIERRMRESQDEISHWGEFVFLVINDDFEQALRELRTIIRFCRENRPFLQETPVELLAELLGNG